MSSQFQSQDQMSRFADDVLDNLGGGYRTEGGETLELGQAASFLLKCIYNGRTCGAQKSGRSWKNIGGLGAFEAMCKEAGFKVVDGRNGRGQACRVVTL